MAKANWEKSPPALVTRFEAATGRRPDLVPRTTFGYPCTSVDGNMATGRFGDRWFVRPSEEDAAQLAGVVGAGPFSPMPGRPMKGHITLPAEVVADDARSMHGSIGASPA